MTFSDAMVLTRTISSPTAFDDQECERFWDLLVQVPEDGIVVEIGCQLGRSSSLVLQAAKDRGFLSVHIDPWTVQPDFARQWHALAWEIDVPHCVFQMRTDQVLDIEWPVGIDLLLIDGDHTADGVRKDLGMAERIKPGGILTAHDWMRDSLPDVETVLAPFVTDGRWEDLGAAGTLGCWRRI